MLAAPVVPLSVAGASALSAAFRISETPLVPYFAKGRHYVSPGRLQTWLSDLPADIPSVFVEVDWGARGAILPALSDAPGKVAATPVLSASWSYEQLETIRPALRAFDKLGLLIPLGTLDTADVTSAGPLARSVLSRPVSDFHLVLDSGGLVGADLLRGLGLIAEVDDYASVTLLVGASITEHSTGRGATPLDAARAARELWPAVTDLRVGARSPVGHDSAWYVCRDAWRRVGPLSEPESAVRALRRAPWFAGRAFSRSDAQLELESAQAFTPEAVETCVRGHNLAVLVAEIDLANDGTLEKGAFGTIASLGDGI